ncbi:MAG TPA: hypothetical protein ENK08_07325 [Chloroflexi bacterium]|nr:hypothetical protein [Chloroflexota bacterium]
MDKGNEQKKILALVILGIGAVLYVAAIVWAGIASLQYAATGPVNLPEFVEQVIVVIGGALATHFGAWMGITFSQGRTLASFRGLLRLDQMAQVLAYLYLGCLVLGLIFWGATGFSPNAAGVLQNLSYTILGVFAGVVAVWLKEG